MEILVCIKQVPDDSVEIRLGADGQPDLSSADPQGNAFITFLICYYHSTEYLVI